MDVKQHDVGLRARDHGDGLVDIACLTDDVDVSGELVSDAGAEHRVVVDEHDPAAHDPLPAARRSVRTTSVPSSRTLWIAASP